MRATIKEKIYIAERLKDLLLTPEEGKCQYREGWSDKRLAEEVNEEFNTGVHTNTVVYLRQELFGKLRRPVPDASLAARMTELEARVERLEELVE